MRADSFALLAVLVAVAAAACTDEAAPAVEPTFENVVERVLAPSCTFGSCHAGPMAAAGLDLTPERACEALVSQPSCLFPDRMRVAPGSPDESFFFHKLTGEGLDEVPTGTCGSSSAPPTNLLMPHSAAKLSAAKLALVRDWIAAGAECVKNGGPAIAAIAADRAAPVAGEEIEIQVTLNKPAPASGQMIAIEVDEAALSAPLQVVVPAGQATVAFAAYALRPASRFALRARAGRSTKELVLRVAGLDIAEVLADPAGDDDQLQWIKLHNRSSVPIDLRGYRIGAGQASYDLVTVPLEGTIPAGGCAVIGGPLQSDANSRPRFSQLVDFQPDLPYAGPQAAGFAIFDGAPGLGGVAAPVDTMLVGAANGAGLRGPDGEIAQPYCGTPSSGMSALRAGPSTCVQAVMQPYACP